jgi:hypothetical protein
MPHPPRPPEQALPARAGALRKAATKREVEAVRLRLEAAKLDRQWAEFRAKRDAERNVKALTA